MWSGARDAGRRREGWRRDGALAELTRHFLRQMARPPMLTEAGARVKSAPILQLVGVRDISVPVLGPTREAPGGASTGTSSRTGSLRRKRRSLNRNSFLSL